MNPLARRTLKALVVVVVEIVFAGCTNRQRACCVAEPPMSSGPSLPGAPSVRGPSYPDESIYQSEGSWTSDAGQSIRLGELAGHPQVVAMFFASCRSTCPLIVQDLRRIEAALSLAARQRVGFVLVSFDTRRDTPAALAAYRQARQLPRSSWTLLRAESDDVLELAALLGVSFREDANGDFMHSNQITVLDEQGKITRRMIGLPVDVAATVSVLERLAAGDGEPPVHPRMEGAGSRPPLPATGANDSR